MSIQPIGAHVSAAGGIWTAIERAQAMGAEAVQLFPGQPQTWRKTKHTADGFQRFRAARDASGIGHAWLHCIYLPNLAVEDPEMWEKSVDTVSNALTIAHLAGADGVVLHAGSHRGRGMEAALPRVAEALERICADAPDDVLLALENTAGQGGTIGRTFGELGLVLRTVRSPRLAVCIDTCHAFAAGYDITKPEGLQKTLEELDNEVGLDRLAVMHANDSKGEFGGGRDRHANIGDGFIGEEGFAVVLGEPSLRHVPMLLEVPGADGKGPDAENVSRLKAIRDRVQT